MKPKLYLFPTSKSSTAPFVSLEDYQELYQQYKNINDYADKLVDHAPYLPKDLETARESNLAFSIENERLRKRLYALGECPDCEEETIHHIDEPFCSCYCGITEDASGPSVIQKLRNEIEGWEKKWDCAVTMAAMAENKLDSIKKIL